MRSGSSPGDLNGNSPAHDFYAGIVEIKHNQSSRSLEISIKLFLDDVGRVLEAETGVDFRLATQYEEEGVERALANYLKRLFSIEIDGQIHGWNWIGHEYEEEALWIYVEALSLPASPNEFGLSCRLLTDYFEKQINYIHFSSGEFSRRWAFNIDYYEDRLSFPGTD